MVFHAVFLIKTAATTKQYFYQLRNTFACHLIKVKFKEDKRRWMNAKMTHVESRGINDQSNFKVSILFLKNQVAETLFVRN